MIDGFLGTLTAEERVLLHLLPLHIDGEEYEVPHDFTQAKISESARIARKHLPRTLHKMLDGGRLKESVRHVPGVKQRRHVYSLSDEGRAIASALAKTIHSQEVSGPDGMVRISSLVSSEYPLIEVLSSVNNDMRYNPEHPLVPPLVASPHSPEGTSRQGSEILKTLMRRAWYDGRVTFDEEAMMQDLIMHLGIERSEVEKVEREVKEEIRGVKHLPDLEEVYLKMLEVVGEDYDSDEFLSMMQKVLEVDSATHGRMIFRAKSKLEMDAQLEEHLIVYRDCMSTAWKDGQITPDEEALLNTLRISLNITPDEHQQVLELVRIKK